MNDCAGEDPLDMLDQRCANCGALVYDSHCRNCGLELPVVEVERPTDGDDLRGIHGA